ncbi:MAG: hypothetical protein WC761_01305 [Candidatus Paceibacterota bacterium]|jgi:hypothetical protein
MTYHNSNIPYYLGTEHDTSLWQAFAETPVHCAGYVLTWEVRTRPPTNATAYWRPTSNDYYVLLVKDASGKVLEYKDGWRGLNSADSSLYEKLSEGFRQTKEEFLKKHTKELADARKALYVKEAKELGLSMKEYAERRKQLRVEAKSEKDMERTAEQMERLFKVGGHLKRLKEDIEYLESVINSDVKKLQISQVDNYLSRLYRARQVLRRWSGRTGNMSYE